MHRLTRNQQQRESFLAPTFPGMAVDHTLRELERAKACGKFEELEEIDPRRCLVIWVKPTKEVRDIVKVVQDRLRDVAPGLSFFLAIFFFFFSLLIVCQFQQQTSG